MDIQKETRKQQTILKLNKIFKKGYLPSRKDALYKAYHKTDNNELKWYANCFIHACFNLSNEQLQNFNLKEMEDLFDHIDYKKVSNSDKIKESLFSVIKKAGLKVEKTSKNHKCNNNQWIVAYYLAIKDYNLGIKNKLYDDYHFILKEKDGKWSEKVGVTSTVNVYNEPPQKLQRPNSQNIYFLQGYYLITNPYAKKARQKGETQENEI